MKTSILPALRILFFFTALTGIIYPTAMTFLSLAVFPYQSNGSMIEKKGTVIGSELIGQEFIRSSYFNSRPSAIGYDPQPSSGTNWGPTDRRMADSVTIRRKQFVTRNDLSPGTTVPKEMLFASSSGVDPHISPEAAMMQVKRIAAVRGLNDSTVKKLVESHIERPQYGIFGNSRVNVLQLNLALDEMKNQ